MAELEDTGWSFKKVQDDSGAPVFKLIGELDLSNVGSLRSAVDASFDEGPDRIVFDLSELQFMDSSGLAMLVAVAERIDTVELLNPRPMICTLIELTGLSGLFRITA
jgi:anti-sigma B factor antagonist